MKTSNNARKYNNIQVNNSKPIINSKMSIATLCSNLKMMLSSNPKGNIFIKKSPNTRNNGFSKEKNLSKNDSFRGNSIENNKSKSKIKKPTSSRYILKQTTINTSRKD